jgi:transposase InsO family protein
MSWKIQDLVAQRLEFVTLAHTPGANFAELCHRFKISRKTGYKWTERFKAGGAAALVDQVRRPVRRCNQAAEPTESLVQTLRLEQPTWGPRKLRRRLQDQGHELLPAVSTFGRILKRLQLIDPKQSPKHAPCQRFCRAEPNELWQMDFKGHFALQRSGRCHPLTVLDDCLRFSVGLEACGNEQTATVRLCLERILSLYGMPECILCDNGSPWAGSGPEHTLLTVWLLRLGIRVIHGRPFHPQTQGKDERFHRTLKADLLARHDWLDLTQAQHRFNEYRRLYNHDRPHEALDLAVPASRYRPSPRSFPSRLPAIEYPSDTLVRPVKSKGEITFRNRFFYVGRAFNGLPVAIHPTATDGTYRVAFAAHTLGLIDLKAPNDRPKGNCFLLQRLH